MWTGSLLVSRTQLSEGGILHKNEEDHHAFFPSFVQSTLVVRMPGQEISSLVFPAFSTSDSHDTERKNLFVRAAFNIRLRGQLCEGRVFGVFRRSDQMGV